MSDAAMHPGEIEDPEENARVVRILELHTLAAPTEAERAELERLEGEQVALEATRTGPA